MVIVAFLDVYWTNQLIWLLLSILKLCANISRTTILIIYLNLQTLGILAGKPFQIFHLLPIRLFSYRVDSLQICLLCFIPSNNTYNLSWCIVFQLWFCNKNTFPKDVHTFFVKYICFAKNFCSHNFLFHCPNHFDSVVRMQVGMCELAHITCSYPTTDSKPSI